jgi:hypothetical protein|uniref:Retrovirus-related Pol polyprotein LINE-1 n=1 Tax=Sipha flava TaxID=143950 RepID=A0A2S2QWZ5_9HEMI
MKDEHGNFITDTKKIALHFMEFFKRILNNMGDKIITYEKRIYYTAEPEILKPTLNKVKTIINTLKNNKAPGDDNINSELIKLVNKQLITKIHKLIYNVRTKEKVLTDWNIAIICPIFKKGDPTEVENYQGISLVDTSYKDLSLTILKRLEKYATDIIGKYQSGFIRGKSTTNHIFTIRQIMEKYYEYDKELHMVFVDFKQVYDTINRDHSWIALTNLGIPNKLIKIIKICNSNTFCKVQWQGELSPHFEIKSGLKQGDAHFHILFNLLLNN